MSDEFTSALEAVFAERADEISGDTKTILKQLWREGVKHGRKLERSCGDPAPAQRMKATVEGKEAGLLMDTVILQKLEEQHARHKELMNSPFLITNLHPPEPEVTFDGILQAMEDFRTRHNLAPNVPGSHIPQSFQSGFSNPWPITVEPFKFTVTPELTRREIYGEWSRDILGGAFSFSSKMKLPITTTSI